MPISSARLPCYDEVVTYDRINSLPAGAPVAFVDMAGSSALRAETASALPPADGLLCTRRFDASRHRAPRKANCPVQSRAGSSHPTRSASAPRSGDRAASTSALARHGRVRPDARKCLTVVESRGPECRAADLSRYAEGAAFRLSRAICSRWQGKALFGIGRTGIASTSEETPRRRPRGRACLTRPTDIAASAQSWLDDFERACTSDPAALNRLFPADSYWRDVLALSWNLQTIAGRDAIVRDISARADKAAPVNFKIAPIARHRTRSRGPAQAASRPSSVSRRQSGVAAAFYDWCPIPTMATGSRPGRFSPRSKSSKRHEEQLDRTRPRG